MSAINQLFFDLDDTLYPAGNGLWRQVSARITKFMVDHIGLSPEEADERRRRYYHQFGTSLTGLMVDYNIEPDHYLSFVHDIELEGYLAPDPELKSMLESLPQRKAIFTNASRRHAQRVLKLLDVHACFQDIIAIEDTGLINKPELRAYTQALTLTGNNRGEGCLFADDRVENLLPATGLGMISVLVNPRHVPIDGFHYRIPNILKLKQAVPELANGQHA